MDETSDIFCNKIRILVAGRMNFLNPDKSQYAEVTVNGKTGNFTF